MSATVPAQAADVAQEGYRLKDFGSFYVGGKQAAISGKPVKEIQFTPGGAPARVDPNGAYQIGQMYVQYFAPLDAKGVVPLLLWHGGGLTGVTYETTPDGLAGCRTSLPTAGRSTIQTRWNAAARGFRRRI